MDVELNQEQTEVLRELIKGLPNDFIAKKLYMSVGTVKLRVAQIFKKLYAKNRVDAAMRGILYFMQQEYEIQEENKMIPMSYFEDKFIVKNRKY